MKYFLVNVYIFSPLFPFNVITKLDENKKNVFKWFKSRTVWLTLWQKVVLVMLMKRLVKLKVYFAILLIYFIAYF